MKNKMIIVCVLLGLVLPLDGQTTLDDCIHYAWKHNLEFKNTQIEVQEAHTDYVAAMGKFMPSVSVQAEVGRHIGRSIDPGTNGYTSDSYNQGTVGMDVTLSYLKDLLGSTVCALPVWCKRKRSGAVWQNRMSWLTK